MTLLRRCLAGLSGFGNGFDYDWVRFPFASPAPICFENYFFSPFDSIFAIILAEALLHEISFICTMVNKVFLAS